MKKITFYLLFLSFYFTYSQVSIVENFNSGTTIPAGWTETGGKIISAVDACEGNSIRDNLWSLSTTGTLTTPNQTGASNGTDLSLSFDYKIEEWDSTVAQAPGWGTIQVQYSINDGGSWTTFYTIDDDNHVTANTCATVTTSVAGVDLPNGSDVKLQFLFTWNSGDYDIYIDNFSATQVAFNPPNCDATLSETTDVSIISNISWSAATGAPTSYDLTVGTTSGGSEILTTTDVGNVTSFNIGVLEFSTTYYVTIVPKNDNGSASDCVEQTFVTKDAPAPPTVDVVFDINACGDSDTFNVAYDVNAQPFVWVQLNYVGGCDSITVDTEGGDFDTEIGLYDSNGFLIGNDDDGGTGTLSSLTFTGLPAGTYYIVGGTFDTVFGAEDFAVSTTNTTRTGTIFINASTPSDETADFVNLQFPFEATIEQGGTANVFAQIFEPGITEPAGQGAGIEAWIGVSDTNATTTTDFESSDWTWIPATYNVDNGNNDEYQAEIGAGLTPGTYYYVSRFSVLGGPFAYGGINPGASDGNFWDGTNFVSGVLTVTPPPPPANDECEDAISLTVNSDLDCGVVTSGTTVFATASPQADDVTGTPNNDVWFSFVASGSAHRVSLLNVTAVTGFSTDMGMGVYDATGGCDDLVLVGDSDPNTLNLSGLTSGVTYLVRVYGWASTNSAQANFDICVGTPPPPPANDACEDATVVGSLPYNISQDASAATNNNGFIVCNGNGMNDGVWYTFTVETSGTIDIAISEIVGWDPEIALYSGACGAFTCVARADSGGLGIGENISAAVNAGTQYWLNIGQWSGTTDNSEGPFTLDISSPDVTLNIEGFENNSTFTFYPNPVKNTLTLTAQNNIENVNIVNMLGQTVLRVAPNAIESEINMQTLANGTYFAQVTIAGVTKTIKVLKQ